MKYSGKDYLNDGIYELNKIILYTKLFIFSKK